MAKLLKKVKIFQDRSTDDLEDLVNKFLETIIDEDKFTGIKLHYSSFDNSDKNSNCFRYSVLIEYGKIVYDKIKQQQ
jgi:hypothetical protein